MHRHRDDVWVPFMSKLEIDARTWAELNQLLDSALDRPAAQRAEWIEMLAPQDEALKPRLRDLLSRTDPGEDGTFLGTLPKFEPDAGDSDGADASGDQPGDQVGPFRLVRELGHGGMGTVWLAERSDGLIERPVALKLPHGASKRVGLALRMARERRILAALTHPNIARLYDAGLTAEGRPFLAIEYVEGRQIDDYCRERQLDLKSRLRLFAQVARGVAYAHTKLVVHRDSETGEYSGHERRTGPVAGFRDCQAARRGRGRRGPAHRIRRPRAHAGVRVARADSRRPAYDRVGRLLARRHSV